MITLKKLSQKAKNIIVAIYGMVSLMLMICLTFTVISFSDAKLNAAKYEALQTAKEQNFTITLDGVITDESVVDSIESYNVAIDYANKKLICTQNYVNR